MKITLLDQLLVFVGGGIGAVARYWVAQLTRTSTAGAFPLGTLAVNLLGCLLIGWLMPRLNQLEQTSDVDRVAHYRFFLVTGILGGFTTFSAFGWETVKLATTGFPGIASLYVIASLVLGIACVLIGYTLHG